MITKDRLREYLWIKENITELEGRLLEIDTRLQKITTELTTDMVQTTKDNDKWTNLIHQRMQVEELLNAEITNGLEEMRFIENAIENLDEREKYLMRLRYIQGDKWEHICCKMNYEWRQIHNIHSGALKKVKSAHFCTK